MEYILMNKNRSLARIKLSINGHIEDVIDVYDQKAFPVGICTNTIKNKELIKARLDKWWSSRAIPLSRKNVSDILVKYNISAPTVLVQKGFGLSLSDQYWIKPINSNMTWSEINYFDNSFSEDVGKIFFSYEDDLDIHNIQLLSPDNTSDGVLRKKWVIADGYRYLIKGGSDTFNQEPFNEVIASKILKLLGFTNFVKYTLYDDFENGICSACKNFITKDTELVSASNIMEITPKTNETLYEHYINTLKQLGLLNASEFLDQMIVLDYIINNVDRHWNNFGIIRDVNTLKFIQVAPIYDSGSSLWYNRQTKLVGQTELSKPFYNQHELQLKLVQNWSQFDFNRLKNIKDIVYDILRKNDLSDANRNITICNALQERIQIISQYQQQYTKIFNISNSDFTVLSLDYLKTLQINLKPAFDYYHFLFVPSKKRKYNPEIDKKIYYQAIEDGFSLEQTKKILLNSPNIKNSQMLERIIKTY